MTCCSAKIDLSKQEDDFVSVARHAHHVLSHANDLSPRNPALNQALKALFYSTTALLGRNDAEYNERLFNRFDFSFINQLRTLMAQAETEMEYFWAAKLYATSDANYDDLKKFIYWRNYAALVEKEIALLSPFIDLEKAKTCFVGQGPLPISLFIYQKMTQADSCIGVDSSMSAVSHAQRLTTAINAQNLIYLHSDGASYDYVDCDVIFVASLIENKEVVFEKIRQDRCEKTTFVMVRSAENLSKLYYFPFETVPLGWDYLGKTIFDADSINTTLLYRLN